MERQTRTTGGEELKSVWIDEPNISEKEEKEIWYLDEGMYVATTEGEEPSRREEFKRIIWAFENNKTPEKNAITAEMFKIEGGILEENMYKIVKNI